MEVVNIEEELVLGLDESFNVHVLNHPQEVLSPELLPLHRTLYFNYTMFPLECVHRPLHDGDFYYPCAIAEECECHQYHHHGEMRDDLVAYIVQSGWEGPVSALYQILSDFSVALDATVPLPGLSIDSFEHLATLYRAVVTNAMELMTVLDYMNGVQNIPLVEKVYMDVWRAILLLTGNGCFNFGCCSGYLHHLCRVDWPCDQCNLMSQHIVSEYELAYERREMEIPVMDMTDVQFPRVYFRDGLSLYDTELIIPAEVAVELNDNRWPPNPNEDEGYFSEDDVPRAEKRRFLRPDKPKSKKQRTAWEQSDDRLISQWDTLEDVDMDEEIPGPSTPPGNVSSDSDSDDAPGDSDSGDSDGYYDPNVEQCRHSFPSHTFEKEMFSGVRGFFSDIGSTVNNVNHSSAELRESLSSLNDVMANLNSTVDFVTSPVRSLANNLGAIPYAPNTFMRKVFEVWDGFIEGRRVHPCSFEDPIVTSLVNLAGFTAGNVTLGITALVSQLPNLALDISYEWIVDAFTDFYYLPTMISVTRFVNKIFNLMGFSLPHTKTFLTLFQFVSDLTAPESLNGGSSFEKEAGIEVLMPLVNKIKQLVKSVSSFQRDFSGFIKAIDFIVTCIKELIKFIFGASVLSVADQKVLEEFITITDYYSKEENAYLLGMLPHRKVVFSLEEKYKRLVKLFVPLAQKNSGQSYDLFKQAVNRYNTLQSKCSHQGRLGDGMCRREPYVMCLFGDTNIGKSVLQSFLATEAIDTLYDELTEHEKQTSVYSLNLAMKHFDGYDGNTIVQIDDIFTTYQNAAQSGAGLYNSMVSCTDFVVPMASLLEKGKRFTSSVILTSTNVSHPVLPDVAYGQCIWRRRDGLWKVTRKIVNGQPMPFTKIEGKVTVDNFRHLKFQAFDPLVPNQPISNVLEIDEFIQRYRTTLLEKHQHQTTLVRALQQSMLSRVGNIGTEDEIIKKILADKSHFTVSGLSVFCKDTACTCLSLIVDGQRKVSEFLYRNTESLMEFVSNIVPENDLFQKIKDFCTSISPSTNMLLALGSFTTIIAACAYYYKISGGKMTFEKEAEISIPDWRGKNAEHFKMRPEVIPKHEWRNSLVTQEIQKLKDETGKYWRVKSVNGNEMIVESYEPVDFARQIQSSGPTVSSEVHVENPYKLAEPLSRSEIPVTRTFEVESQNANDALRCLAENTYILKSSTSFAHATHVHGQFLLAPYHFFECLEESEVFDVIRATTAHSQPTFYTSRHLVHLKNSDVALYYIARDVAPKKILRQFPTLNHMPQRVYFKGIAVRAFNGQEWTKDQHTDIRVSEYSDYHHDGKLFKDYSVMSFHGMKSPGKCGAIYVTTDNVSPAVVGMHIGFDRGKSYLRIITQEDILFLSGELAKKTGHPIMIGEDIPSFIKEDAGPDIAPAMPFVGYMDPQYVKFQPKKHAKIQSPAYGQLYEVRKDNSVLSRWDPRVDPEHSTESILKKGLLKYTKPYREFDWDQIDRFREFHVSRNQRLKKILPPKVRSYDEVINGIRNPDGSFVGHFFNLNMKSSPGFGWKLTGSKGKTELFHESIENGYIRYIPKQELQVACEVLEKKIRSGIVPHVITTNCVKDELRLLEKIRKGSTRNFVMFPVEWTIVSSCFFKDWIVAMIESHGDESAQIGIDPTGLEWHDMIVQLKRMSSTNGFDGDYAAYDGCVFYQQLIPIIDSINEFYDDGEENARCRHVLALRMMYSLILSENEVHYKTQGQTSGNVLTSPVNCEVNAQLFGYAFEKCWEKYRTANSSLGLKKEDYNLFNMHKFVYSKFYGDDNIHAVHQDVAKWFYPSIIADVINSTGFEITDAKKTGVLKWSPIEDLSFLKMVTTNLNGYYVGQLDKVSIEEMSNWIRDNNLSDPYTKLIDNFETMLRFAFPHGREYYETMLAKCNRFLRERGERTIVGSYNNAYRVFFDTKIGLKSGSFEGSIPALSVSGQNDQNYFRDCE